MFYLLFGVVSRIFSNSFLNVFQKLLTDSGEKASVINFYTYLGLTVIGLLILPCLVLNPMLLTNVAIMGVLGALGNYFIIKALSVGDLSELAPINCYKPVIAVIMGILVLKEMPKLFAIVGILFIITGTFVLFGKKINHSQALFYRFLALLFSGTEAVFIKKVILLSNIESAFLFWAISGLLFSLLITINKPLKISKVNIKYQILLILFAALMQYSTNYVFAKMNVAYALALFQMSVVVSVFLGVNIFKEKHLFRKLISSAIMIFGAVLIILN